jgi:hypothetical protein
MDAFKVAAVVGYQDESRFPARQSEQHVIAEHFREASHFQSLAPGQLGEEIARVVPGLGGWRHYAPASSVEIQHVSLEAASITR